MAPSCNLSCVELTDGPATRARVEELEAAVAARDRFIAAVGHELRNSMAPLVMLADAFKLPADQATFDRRMDMLARNLGRLNGALERVTDVSQLRGEKLVLAKTDVELVAIVRDVVEACRADAAAASVELRVEAAAEVTGSWDRARLRQIVLHLVSNAVRHSGGGPVEISVSGDEAQAELVVADRGRGIALERRAGLFDSFDVPAAQRSAGLGVGLWIVQTLCQRFGGSVVLVEDHAPGARLRVLLPRV